MVGGKEGIVATERGMEPGETEDGRGARRDPSLRSRARGFLGVEVGRPCLL